MALWNHDTIKSNQVFPITLFSFTAMQSDIEIRDQERFVECVKQTTS